MNKLTIYLENGTFSGPVVLSSPSSPFSAVRVARAEMDQYYADLNQPGLYMLLLSDDTVYVGQSGQSTIEDRVKKYHSGHIEAMWKTLIAFSCRKYSISNNELLFLHNALCEYVYSHYAKCLTLTPAREDCNKHYRDRNYHLNSSSIHTCNQYFSDMEFYLSYLTKKSGSVEPGDDLGDPPPAPPADNDHKALFYYKNETRDALAFAEILIHQGHTKKRKTVVRAGSKVSNKVLDAFQASAKVRELRYKLKEEGILEDRILKEDVVFESQSGAGAFVSGGSFDGNTGWRTVNGDILLKELLE